MASSRLTQKLSAASTDSRKDGNDERGDDGEAEGDRQAGELRGKADERRAGEEARVSEGGDGGNSAAGRIGLEPPAAGEEHGCDIADAQSGEDEGRDGEIGRRRGEGQRRFRPPPSAR